jgi:hypothetical protein
MQINLKQIFVLNEAIELLSRGLSHSREATLAPLVQEVRDELVEGFKAQVFENVTRSQPVELNLVLNYEKNKQEVLDGQFAVFPFLGSEFIRNIAYNFGTSELRVRFKAGHEWSYLNVPRPTLTDLLAGDYDCAKRKYSVGKAYNRLIKGRFDGALVVNGQRQARLYTVVYSAIGRTSEIRLRFTSVVSASSAASALVKVENEVKQKFAGFRHHETLEGDWIDSISEGFVRVGS